MLIPQEVKERLAICQQHYDGVVVDMVEIPAGLLQAAAGEKRERRSTGRRLGRVAWGAAPAPWPSFYRRPGVHLPPPRDGGQGVPWPPRRHLGLGFVLLVP